MKNLSLVPVALRNHADKAVLHMEVTCSGKFLSLQTLSVRGCSNHLYISVAHLASWLNNPTDRFIESDGDDLAQMWLNGSSVTVKLLWLSVCSNGVVSGLEESFSVNVSDLTDVINSTSLVRKLVHLNQPQGKSHIVLTPSAHKQLHGMDQQHRHAFIKCLARNFSWGSDSEIHVYGEYGYHFAFTEYKDGNRGISGGICCFKETQNGRSCITYSVHT